jgi:serine protease Do
MDFNAGVAAIAERLRPVVVEVRTNGYGGAAGIIWRSDGTIVTNHHVAPGERADVRLTDGRSFAGTVATRDPANDLAVVNIPASGLPTADIGDARALRPGAIVVAVGHPFGVRGAVTVGVVHEALARSHGQGRELVQADVRLAPGNSGGPLADACGRVVGVNAMVGGGLGLAVPSHVVERLLVRHHAGPVLGIEARDVDVPPALAARAPVGTSSGILVVGVRAGGAAERAGVLIGDLLLAIDGWALDGTNGLQAALANHGAGDLRLGLLRGGVPRDIVVRGLDATPRAA